VLIPGIGGSGPDHWLSWLAAELTAAGREVRLPDRGDAAEPRLADWLASLRLSLAGLADDGYDVLAHSLGAVLWLHHVSDPEPGSPRPARVALISPPQPTMIPVGASGFLPVPLNVDAVRRSADGTVLVGGEDDPFCPQGVAVAYGAPLKIATTVIAGGGQLSAESGYSRWPAALDWCGRDNLAFIG
jgi:predicted alpha/beta hydrolase family esterase